MPFDSITGPAKAGHKIWAVNTDRIKISKKAVLVTTYVSLVNILILSSICYAIASPYTDLALPGERSQTASKTQVKGAETQAKVITQGIKIESFEKVAEVTAKPMRALAILKFTQRGGYEKIYKEAGAKYNVPWQVIAAVHYVETGQSGDTDARSSAGALGPMQFMPGTFNAYQVDGNKDGSASIFSVHDAIYTAAKHLAANGADSGNVRGALYNYNHSNAYVERVLAYARGLGYNK